MQELLDAVADLVALVSPAKIYAVASRLRGLMNAGAAPNANLLADTPAARVAIGRVVAAWKQVQTSGDEVAGMLLGASHARWHTERESSIELVWTGPTTDFVPLRKTEQVLLDLITYATKDIFLVSFVAHCVPNIVFALNNAVMRGVRIRILIEAPTMHGGTLNVDHLTNIRSSVQSAELFTWKNKSEDFFGGKVHAKVVVVDRTKAFITSANITSHALEVNMEAGVVIIGGSIPITLIDHLESLIDVGILKKYD